MCYTVPVLFHCLYPSSSPSSPKWQLQLTLQLTGEWRFYSLAGKLSCMSMSSVLSDSLDLTQNHGVGAAISSLSISNPQQVEEQRTIKKFGRKMLLPYWNSSQSMHFKAASNTWERSWKVGWECFTDGLLCWWISMSMFTSEYGIGRRKALVKRTIYDQLNTNIELKIAYNNGLDLCCAFQDTQSAW